MGNQDILKRGMLGIIVGILFILSFLIIRPIIIPIVFGLLLAYIFHPVFKRLNKKLGKRTSAFILILGLIMIIAVPVVYFTPVIVKQTFEAYLSVQKINLVEPLRKLFPILIDDNLGSSLSLNLNNLLAKVFSSFMNQFTNILVNAPNLLLQFAVFLFTFFFSLKDSEKLKKYFSDLSPFSKSTETKFFNEFRGITNAIIYGQVFIGVVQGIILGAGLFILGVPKALTLTFLAILLSIIPLLGSWLVWLPVSIFLLVSGQIFSGIFLMVYGALFVSTIDNILRPYFLSKSSHLPIALSVIGTIGGLYFFGIAGLILGPLILAYSLIIIDFYKQGKLSELFKKSK